MNVEHKLTFAAECPVDETVVDEYELTVYTGRTISVELILDTLASITRTPLYQEEITFQLAELLNARVRTEGIHSNVRTTVEAEPTR